jgi:large subunit ribosomal protein L6
VAVELRGQTVKVSGPLGSLEMDCHPRMTVRVDDATRQVEVVNPCPESRLGRQLHGTTRALIANMVTGVSQGFEKKMEIYGTGYGVKEEDGKLVIQVGFARPAEVVIPEGIEVIIETPATRGNDVPARFTLRGADRCRLGQLAADVRRVKPPEPYRGKGIRYADEQIRRKVGKAFASGGA